MAKGTLTRYSDRGDGGCQWVCGWGIGRQTGHRSRARVTKERQAREVVPFAAEIVKRVPILQEIGTSPYRAPCRKCRKGSRATPVGAAALPHAPPPPRRRRLQKSVQILRKSRRVWPVAGSGVRRSPRLPRHPGIAQAPCVVASGAGSPSCASSGRGRGKSSRNGGKLQNGGGGWIRTIELIEGRFTVCCGWPLRYPTTWGIRETALWWSGRDSNPRPPRCERDALPAELPPQFSLLLGNRRGRTVSADSRPRKGFFPAAPNSRRRAPAEGRCGCPGYTGRRYTAAGLTAVAADSGPARSCAGRCRRDAGGVSFRAWAGAAGPAIPPAAARISRGA